MNMVDILFTSEWVTMLFIVILAAIASKIFVLPKSYEKERIMRITLMKRREERKGYEKSFSD